MYLDAGVEIDTKTALLMCSAIISDTLIFRSPTCTEMDREAGKALAEIAGINIKEHAHEMFFAGSNISEKTAKELFTGDFKRFLSEIRPLVSVRCHVWTVKNWIR